MKFSHYQQQQSYSVVCSPGRPYSTYLYKITLVSWQVHISCLFSFCVLQPCGVDYELKTYISESPEEKPHKRWPFLKYYFANWNNIESCDALILTDLIMDFNFCCYSLYRNTVRLAIRKITYAPERPLPQVCIVVYTWAEHHVKDSQCLGMSQSCFLGDKIGRANSMSFWSELVIWRNERGICLRHLEITLSSFIFFEEEIIVILSSPRVWTDSPTDQMRL